MCCLGTGWENKNRLLSSKISNLIQLLVSVMSHCSQTFSVDFVEFLWKRGHLKNLKKSVNKFLKNKKFSIMMKKKWMIITLIYWQISDEKFVPKHLISLL